MSIIKACTRTSGVPRELNSNASLTISCRRDLQTAPSRCKNPRVCGEFCTNAAATDWKVFERDGESQIGAEERRVERGLFIQQVLRILKKYFKIYLVATAPATLTSPKTQEHQAPPHSRSSVGVGSLECSCIKLLIHVAKHIELLIYRAASSKLEYANTATLLRRVQHFAAILSSDLRWKVKIVARQNQASTAFGCSPRSHAEMKRRLWFFSSTRWESCAKHTPTRNRDEAPVSHGVLINANEQCYRSIAALTQARVSHRQVNANLASTTRQAGHELQGSQSMTPQHSPGLKSLSSFPFAVLFQGHHAPLLTQIFGYLDGTSVVGSFAISRHCYSALPLAITNLRVSTSGLAKFLKRVWRSNNGELTRVLPNLQSLCVVAENSPSRRPAATARALGDVARKRKRDAISTASNSASSPAIAHAAIIPTCLVKQASTSVSGESAIRQLAEVLHKKGCPQLRKLSMNSTFTNSVSQNAIFCLTSALQTGGCPELEYLWLCGNALGDYGAMCISQLVASKACPKLSLLDLRSNVVGHDGMRYLATAISNLQADCRLKQLCLGNNLITESVFMELLPCFHSGAMRQLRFLGLERNFLTRDCLDALAPQAVSGNCPDLRELCVGGNFGLAEEQISSAFRDAADSTKGASWGLFRATTSVASSSPLAATSSLFGASDSAHPSKRLRVDLE